MTDANDLAGAPDSTLTDAPEVDTASGRVRGLWRGPSAAFLGIPFAAPPVGNLRFLAPAGVTPWSGVRDALAYGPTPQRREAATVTTSAAAGATHQAVPSGSAATTSTSAGQCQR